MILLELNCMLVIYTVKYRKYGGARIMIEQLNELSFEEALKKLEEIAASLENDEIPLEKSMALYEEGMKLSKQCNRMLKNAEEKMTELIQADGTTQPYDEVLED